MALPLHWEHFISTISFNSHHSPEVFELLLCSFFKLRKWRLSEKLSNFQRPSSACQVVRCEFKRGLGCWRLPPNYSPSHRTSENTHSRTELSRVRTESHIHSHKAELKAQISLHFKYAFYWVQKSVQIISVQLDEIPQSERPHNQHPAQGIDGYRLPEFPVYPSPER